MITTKSGTRWMAFLLAVLMLISILPIAANAASIVDGSKTATVGPVERYYFLRTTAGTVLGASAYQYTTNDGLIGPAYCIDHGLNYASRALPITGKYTVSVATAAAFASAYPQHDLETFLGRYPDDSMLDGLTEQEYAYATQLAIWATLGQLAIEGTAFTNGRETIAQPTGDAQQMRIFHVIQLILEIAKRWPMIYQPGMYIRAEDGKLGGNISIPGDMTLDFAADNQRYGFKREVIDGVSYYTREYTFASATSTYYSGYNIELWTENAPAGTIFTDTDNHELVRGTFQEKATWRLAVENKHTTLNENGFEYSGKAKLCIPVETTPNEGEITVNCGAYVMQYDIYLAKNDIIYEQSYIISDPSKGTQTANAVLNWGSELTEKAALQVVKVNGSGQALPGASFTLTGTDGSSRTGTTNDEGVIDWKLLDPNTTYTLTETTAPAGYALVDPITVKVQGARVNYVTVQDSTQKRLTVKKVDKQTGYSLAGAVIAFEQIDGDFYTTGTTDPAGVIQMDADQLPVGSYKVYELTPPAGYELDSAAQTVNWTGRNDVTLTFRNVRKPTLIIYKCDTDNHYSLPGASFEVYKNGQLVTTVITNDNGLAYVPDVTTGYYTVKEIVAPAGYILDGAEHGVYVNNYDPATTDDPRITIRNDAMPMLRIVKYDAQIMKPLPDTTFAVYRDTELVGKYTTATNGEILLYDLEPGTYLVQEIAAPDSHVVNSTPQEIKLEAGTQNYSLVFLNYVKPGIHLRKLDSQTMKPLANACFRITEIGGRFSQEYITDPNGEIDLSGLTPGSYTVEETTAPDGYLIDDARRAIKINEGEDAVFVFADTRKPMLTVLKYDAQREKLLPGAAFRIARIEDGTHYLDRITDAQGRITIENLDPGVYSVQEINAPSGYIVNDTEYHVRLYPGQPAQLVVCNDKKPDLKIVKKDANTGAVLAGAVFKINRADGPTLTTETTDINGEIFLKELDPGVYEIAEVSPPPGYVLDSQPQTVFVYPGNIQTLVFYNTPVGGLVITKSDEETGARISGVQFEVRKLDGEIVGQYTTDRSGTIQLPSLESGWYTVTELKAAPGYRSDPTPQQIEVKDGQTATLALTNHRLSRILIHKIDANTGKGIYGAVFVLYDSNHNPIGEYVSSQDGYVYIDDDLADGRYYVREIKAADGYILDTELKTIYVRYGAASEIIWKNTAIRGQIQIVKKSANDNPINGLPAGTPLEGAVFEIYNKAGKVVDTIRTDRNGRAASKLLPLSRYTVKEVTAPTYYAINPTLMNAYLEYEGQIVCFEVLDESIATGVAIKKTGYAEVMPGQPIRYTVSGIANTSTVSLGSFYWRDTLPGQVTLTQLITGTYNQLLSYKIIYKTNTGGDRYRTLADNLSTTKNYVLDARPATLGLAANERVTEIIYIFGAVKAGFAEVETAYISGKVNSGLSNGSSIVNVADVGGLYNDQWIMGVSRWNTGVYAKTTPLPKTGY